MVDRVYLRLGAAVFLPYGLGSAASILLAAVLPLLTPLPRAGAVMTGTMLGYALMVPVILWCFATARLLRMALVLAGVMLAAVVLGLLLGGRT